MQSTAHPAAVATEDAHEAVAAVPAAPARTAPPRTVTAPQCPHVAVVAAADAAAAAQQLARQQALQPAGSRRAAMRSQAGREAALGERGTRIGRGRPRREQQQAPGGRRPWRRRAPYHGARRLRPGGVRVVRPVQEEARRPLPARAAPERAAGPGLVGGMPPAGGAAGAVRPPGGLRRGGRGGILVPREGRLGGGGPAGPTSVVRGRWRGWYWEPAVPPWPVGRGGGKPVADGACVVDAGGRARALVVVREQVVASGLVNGAEAAGAALSGIVHHEAKACWREVQAFLAINGCS